MSERWSDKNDIVWLYCRKSIVAIHLAGAVIAFFVAVDVLSSSPFLNDFVNVVGSILPIVPNFAQRSLYPELMRLYGAVMILTAPYWLFVWMRGPHLKRSSDRMLGKIREKKWKALLLPLLPVAMVIGLYIYLFLAHPTDLHLAPFQSERWALAVFGPILYCWAPAFGVLMIVLPIQVLLRHARGE